MTGRSARGATMLAVLSMALGVGAAGSRPARQAMPGAVRDISIVAERFKFTPDRIEVNQGEKVRVTIRSADGTHGFAIKKLKVDTTVPKGGDPVAVEFSADTPGEYTITCSEYCGRGHSHMRAVLVVLPGGASGSAR